ncbi:MAG TPA: hypothetical protein VJ749_14675 [Pyrinomonadaceae bacterium]|nr:hypothetical protein [Pyrinomonadaceae bacterium]
MITGFNTDIEHDGVVYHVQTEDKGLDTPIILSLVYAGGTILASKRSPYEDLIAAGFSDEVLAERLKRQHKLICAAIHSGRIDDLKKMARPARQPAVQETVAAEPVVEEPDPVIEQPEPVIEQPEPVVEEFEFEYGPITQEWTPPPPAPPVEETVVEVDAEIIAPEAEPVVYGDGSEQGETEEPLPDGLVITILDDEEFYSGEKYTLRVFIADRLAGNEKAMPSAAVSIKILGTTFRPLIYSLKTASDGVATVATQIPEFTSGRAAVLVRAVVKDQAAELRRVIHPAK